MSEIELNALAHSYHASPQSPADYAIHQLNHTWKQGVAYALLGPSGCGKTTLLNIISGLLSPSSGDILFDGKPVNNLPPEQRNIAQVFQFPVVYDSMSVYENLAFPLKNIKKTRQEIAEKVNEIAGILELTPLLHKKAKQLTADEKQKVSMGRGLVRDDVSAILFDEPLTVIDPQLKWRLRRKLKQIHEKFNITMIYVTHDQLEASTFADYIAVMYEGDIVQLGTPQELFESPAHTFVGYFIGSPGMNFIDIQLQNNNAVFEDITLPLPTDLLNTAKELDAKKLTLGIRPEFIQLATSEHPGTLNCPVEYIEDLGTYKMLTLSLGSQQIKVRVDENTEITEKNLSITFPDQWLKLYADDHLVTPATTER